ncbi:class I SAM-dependent methyltransferase [Aestuariispira ectoiniformans]|uniref:class I SAM-dependent methyltransferase n=1 Tax=Aestuariispira ectoiniformans TaxID=2775080 RepID=UPI00223B93C4|nr:class I SAM-dependent methyltransferase [Aestuariispira ectoiniformans]
MAQNIYDDPTFFEGYSQLNRSVHGLAGAPEWPSIQAILPDLTDKKILDLGCGFGWFSRWARANGAGEVLGLDLSEKMIDRAKQETNDDEVEYQIADLDRVDLPEAVFDLVYSSLAFHYVEDFDDLVRRIYRTLRPQGHLVCTIEHPIFMAPVSPGWSEGKEGVRIWPLNQYSVEGKRTTNWLADGVVKYHRTLGTTLNSLIHNGFRIEHLNEWSPSAEQLEEMPALEEEMDRPMMMIIKAQR